MRESIKASMDSEVQRFFDSRDPLVLHDVQDEMVQAAGLRFAMEFDLHAATSLVGALRLSLREKSEGECAEAARGFIAAIIDHVESKGFHHVAKLLKLGEEFAG